MLEKHEVRRLGAQRYVSFDVRVVAATNRNLAAEVASATSRRILYFRIAGAHVYVPPLRDRMDDLRLLVDISCCVSIRRGQFPTCRFKSGRCFNPTVGQGTSAN